MIGGSQPSRRELLLGAVGLGTALIGSAGCAPVTGGRPQSVAADPARGQARGDTPSFVVVLSDDHRADHFGFLGVAPGLQTPALDRMAAEGVHFTDSTVSTALCSPSRASIITGQYARRHGVRNNLTAWDPANRTLFDELAASGFRCGYIGKWHMPGALPDLRGVDTFITFTVDEGQGVYVDCPLMINGVPVDRPGTYISTDLTDLALEWIAAGDPAQPYCLILGHKAVHQPFLPPADLQGALDGAALMPRPDEAYAWQTLLDRNVWEGTAGNLQRVYQRYCETLLGLDREVGRLLDAVDAHPRGRNTVVVYTSDNGYAWGEHTLTGKRWPFEVTAEVPLIVRWPEGIVGVGRSSGAPVVNIDIAPSILDLAGLPIPPAMQGRSWAGHLRGDEAGKRSEVYYEYFADYPYQVPPHQAVRTEEWLYVEYERGLAPQLFDRGGDPGQRSDLLAGSGSANLDSVRLELAQRLAALRAEAA